MFGERNSLEEALWRSIEKRRCDRASYGMAPSDDLIQLQPLDGWGDATLKGAKVAQVAGAPLSPRNGVRPDAPSSASSLAPPILTGGPHRGPSM